jgi:hypothetical protein
MLEVLQGALYDRQLRLFGVACVRALPEYIDACSGVWRGDRASYCQKHNRSPIWAGELKAAQKGDRFLHAVSDRAGPSPGYLQALATLVKAVAGAEDFADGQTTGTALETVHNAAWVTWYNVLEPVSHQGDQLLACAAVEVSQPSAYGAALAARKGLVEIAGALGIEKEFPGDLMLQCNILRDIVGNRFRSTSDISPEWLSCNEGTVEKLARSIYEQRTFDRLPILADALEHAGCHDEAVLAHCRDSGPHNRGCWVIDLLLAEGGWNLFAQS